MRERIRNTDERLDGRFSRRTFLAGAAAAWLVNRVVEETGFEVYQPPIKDFKIDLQNPFRLVKKPVEKPAEVK